METETDTILEEAKTALEAEAPKFGLRSGVGAIPWAMLIDLAIKLITGCVSPTPAAAANPGLGNRLRARFAARQLAPTASVREITAMVDACFAAGAKATAEKLEAFQQAAQSVQG